MVSILLLLILDCWIQGVFMLNHIFTNLVIKIKKIFDNNEKTINFVRSNDEEIVLIKLVR